VFVRPVPAAGTIRGRVQGCTDIANPATCTPIAGALVDVFTAGTGVNPTTGSTYVTTSAPSASDGSFTVSGLTNGTPYRLRYRATGYQTAFYAGPASSSTATVTPPFGAADLNLRQVTGNSGTITGTVTVPNPGGTPTLAPDGTSVRLYDSRGYVSRTTTSGGTYTFTNVPAGSDYYLEFGRGNPNFQAVWSGPAPAGVPSARSQGVAVKQTVPSGGTLTLNAELLTNLIVFTGTTGTGSTNGGCTSNGCTPTNPTIVVSSVSWTANQWAGFQVRWFGARGAGRWYTIQSNTANTLTLAQTTPISQGQPGPASGLTVQIADPLVRDSGVASGGATATTVTQGTVSVSCALSGCTYTALPNQWATNQWAGGQYRLRIVAGTGLGQVRTISSNTATQITVSSAFSPAPGTDSVFEIERVNRSANAVLEGTAFRADTGAPIFASTPPSGQAVEVRLYATTGAFLGRTTVGAPQQTGTFGGVGRNYSFDSWSAPGIGGVSGIAPGTYKVLFRVVGSVTDGASPPNVFCSTWATNTPGVPNVVGGPGAGSFAFAPTVNVKPAAVNTLDVSLTKSPVSGGIVLASGVPVTPGAACTLN
jgi:hypothetical protein